jgi:hypothetical protein
MLGSRLLSWEWDRVRFGSRGLMKRRITLGLPSAAWVFLTLALPSVARGAPPEAAAPGEPLPSLPEPPREPPPEPPRESPAPEPAPPSTPEVSPFSPPAPTGTLEMGGLGPATGSAKDQSQSLSLEDKRKVSKNPFRGSTLTFDQSISTATIGVGDTPQSYMPVYQWWWSFRPRFYFTDHLYLSARFDFYKEFTNSDEGQSGATTDYREDDFGDIWASLIYEQALTKSGNTKVSGGLRFLFPTSKASQAADIYVQAGAVATITQKVPIHDASAKFLNDVHFRFFTWYNHPFSQYTTPGNSGFSYVRENTDDQSFLSDQLAGTTLIDHQLMFNVEAAVQITPRLDFAIDLYEINQWHYSLPAGGCTKITTGCAPITNTETSATGPVSDQEFVQLTWFAADLNWDVFDQVSLGIGYYNLQNELSNTGQNRGFFGANNIWWSPDARFFFDITANLDAIYDSLAPKGSMKKAAQQAREETVRSLSSMHF